MYTDTSLKQHEYRLHAVMVHEGTATLSLSFFFKVVPEQGSRLIHPLPFSGSVDAGHYWAYVLDHKRNVWLKCNDNTVNEATWDELARESMGGHSNTSAYSLIYINASRPELTQESDSAGGTNDEKKG